MMRNVARASTRKDHVITGTLLRRPFAAASCKAINKAIDSTPVMETAATATTAIVPAAFSAAFGLESAQNKNTSHPEMPPSPPRQFCSTPARCPALLDG